MRGHGSGGVMPFLATAPTEGKKNSVFCPHLPDIWSFELETVLNLCFEKMTNLLKEHLGLSRL